MSKKEASSNTGFLNFKPTFSPIASSSNITTVKFQGINNYTSWIAWSMGRGYGYHFLNMLLYYSS